MKSQITFKGTIAKPQDLADKLDGYECVRKTNRKPANLNPKVQQQGNVRSNTYSRDNGDHNVNQKPMKQEKGFPRSQYDRKDRPKFTCYSCGGEGHVKKFCPKLVKTNSDQDSRRKANVLRTVVVKMHDENRVLTAFSTHNEVYQWKVMPFGLSGASGTFQKIMNNVLRSHSSYAQAYIDDIIVYSKTWDEHLIHLRNVLQELENAGFSVKLRKCTFAAKELQFLGHKIGGGKHAPDEEKIAAIKRLERPKTKKDVRSVLGLMGFYRSYIPNYAEFATPLTELTKGKKSGDVKWGKREEESFCGLKKALCEATALNAPDFGKPFEIHADASDYAVGCCLTQKDEKGNYRPIAFVSQKFNKTRRNWATIEKEAYAILFGFKKFDKWLHGTTVEIVTDHNPLKYLIEKTPKSPKLTRWALALQRWSYKITHRPGILNQDADALSRLQTK
ncbi:Retrovirus-related Pol polyprotein from transposon opus [Araneus ventricosus]|uniref:RNA-directed DNA polymerase n=1 Tax=Araneus ventricosus TaxID=182803 RepID=A0A4Y2JSN1_ARAVE|nr:Retrovirus-related Pol polyprotein from transposon opus [Araneus ventricosus]